jgi:hypothetical protein
VHGVAPLDDERIDGVEAGAGRLKARASARVELVERPERAGHDDEPSAGPEAGCEGAQHARGGEVARLRDRVDLVGRVGVRAHPRRGVGEDDVDLAQLGGQGVDGAAVADVEDAALDARPGPRRGRRGGAHALGVAAREQDAVLAAHGRGERLDERPAETLVGPRDEGGASSGHASRVRSVAACRKR